MKRVAGFLFCLLTLFFWSCYEFEFPDNYDPDNNNGNLPFEDGKTRISFVNRNIFSVEIFSDASRFNRIASVEPRSTSKAVETSPNPDGAVFYPTYRIVIDGVVIPYEGEEIIARIDKGQNDVKVHLLTQLSDDEKAAPISDETYIVVQNNSTFSLSLRQGNTELPVEGSTSTILNAYEEGLYLITPGPASDYTLMRNTTIALDCRQNVTEFTSAKLYLFSYGSGYNFELRVRALTIGQALSLNPR